jgi:hypothetical protein
MLLADSQEDIVHGEWLEVFSNIQDVIPQVVFQPQQGSSCEFGRASHSWWIAIEVPVFYVSAHLRTLRGWSHSDQLSSAEIEPGGSGALCSKICGSMHRIRITSVLKGPPKKEIKLFYRKTDSLSWDPGKLEWTRSIPFMKFTTKLGREILKRSKVVPDVAERKWSGILPTRFKLHWKNVWDRSRISKEAGMLWLIWHRSIAVNVWCRRINKNIDQGCPVCATSATKTVLHRF